MHTTAASIIALLSYTVSASFYPPDYVVMRQCVENGPVQVCALNKNANNPRLEITYSKSGTLWKEASPLDVFVQFEGQEGKRFGPLVAVTDKDQKAIGARFVLNQYDDVKVCYRATVQDTPDYTFPSLPRCPTTSLFPLLPGGPGNGSVQWFYNPAPADEDRMISRAGSGPWKVQVSFVNQHGHWDSLFGKNYRFEMN
jgi:hypothetical protein